MPSGISPSIQSNTSCRDQTWPGRTSTGAASPSAQIATAMPGWRGPIAPGQSIAAKWEKRLTAGYSRRLHRNGSDACSSMRQ